MSNKRDPEISVEWNPDAVMDRFESRRQLAQTYLDTQVMKDSDRYVPYRSGALARSVQTATDPGSGRVVWDTPYAHRRYVEENVRFTKDIHPSATSRWFEVAKKKRLAVWVAGVKKILGE